MGIIKTNKFKNIFKIVHHAWKYDKALVFINLSKAISDAVIALIGIYLSKIIIDELMDQNRLSYLVIIIVVAALIIFVCNLIGSHADSKSWYRIVMLRLKLVSQRGEKLMKMDFENTENPQVLDKLERSNQSISTYISASSCAVTQIIGKVLAVVPNLLITIISYLIILVNFSPLIVLFVLLTVFLQYIGNMKINQLQLKLNEELAPLYRKRNYYESQMEDPKFSKEIRIYKLFNLLIKKYDFYRRESIGILSHFQKKISGFRILDLLINLIRYGIVNIYLFNQVINDSLTIGDFSLYLATIIAFSTGMEAIIQLFGALNHQALLLNDFFDFLELPDENDCDLHPSINNSEIMLDNVSFSYPNSKDKVINNLLLKIKPGEKLALVGVNGCGKTTLVKLLVGLYKASEGKITYGGREIYDYNRRGYFDLFSTVFQDVNVFAMTVAENICLCEQENINYDKLKDALILAGLWDDVEKLKEQYQSQLMKIFYENGVELSGGQTQKLAMSRALYQDHPIIILDEPTASLDPLAEYNIYYHFDEIIKNKTAIYISHRLSSTRFCDKIAFLNNGHIVEYGTHNELINLNGLYAEMFRKQAHYYQGGDAIEL